MERNEQYTTRISRALSLINETKIFFHEMENGKTIDQIHRTALEDNIFDKTSGYWITMVGEYVPEKEYNALVGNFNETL